MSEERGPGRPLDHSRDAVILEAAVELLTEVGDRLTMLAVAQRAGVSLSTIYRRWATKTELVIAALESLLAPVLETRTAGEMLEAASAALMTRGDLLPGLLAARRSDAAYAHLIRDRAMAPLRDVLREQVRARATDPLDEGDVAIIADIGPALIFLWGALLGEQPTADTTARVAALVDMLTVAASR